MSDLIKREDVLTITERLRDRCNNDEMAFALNWAASIIRDMTAVDAVPVKHGRWLPHPNKEYTDTEICSSCGMGTVTGNFIFAFCPRCGAKMDGGKQDG